MEKTIIIIYTVEYKFGDEVILHSQLHHPNIVRLLGVYYPIGSQLPMLVMEFFPHTLLQLIERRVAINKEAILLDVANGLDYLHSKRPPIIHCNIKASNILLTTDHKAKITDLSMSKLGDALKEYNYNTVPGNPYMMPPETFVHNPVYNEKLDVFSFGCLILHILTGNIIMLYLLINTYQSHKTMALSSRYQNGIGELALLNQY